MIGLSRRAGFWRLWIALSVLWILGVYVVAHRHEWQCMFRYCTPAGHLFDNVPFSAEAYWGWLFIAFAPPAAALAMAGLTVWIGRGFRKAPVKPRGWIKQPVDPMSPRPSAISEPPADAHIVGWERPDGSKPRSWFLLRPGATMSLDG